MTVHSIHLRRTSLYLQILLIKGGSANALNYCASITLSKSALYFPFFIPRNPRATENATLASTWLQACFGTNACLCNVQALLSSTTILITFDGRRALIDEESEIAQNTNKRLVSVVRHGRRIAYFACPSFLHARKRRNAGSRHPKRRLQALFVLSSQMASLPRICDLWLRRRPV